MYRDCLTVQPDQPDALQFLGVLQAQLGQSAIAIELLLKAVALQPTNPIIRFNLATVYEQAGLIEEALRSFTEAIRIDNTYAAAHERLASLWMARSDWNRAAESFAAAAAGGVAEPSMYLDWGRALDRADRPNEAVDAYRRAIEIEPTFVEAYGNLGNLLVAAGRWDEAARHYRQAIELRPNSSELLFNYAVLLMQEEKWEPARDLLMQARQLKNHTINDAVVSNLLHCKQHLCEWDDVHELARLVVESLESLKVDVKQQPVSPLIFLALPIETTSEQQLRCSRIWAEAKERVGKEKRAERVGTPLPRGRDRRIRVGYLSGDFNTHPVGYLIPELIEAHSRERFEIIGYSYGKDDGSFNRRRLENGFDRFVELACLSNLDAAAQIADDQVDILIDLQGYTRNSRIEILQHRPAPIQIAYLGFASTLGTDYIDYMIVDDFVVTTEMERCFAEKLIRLPGCFMVNDRLREIADATPTRRALELPEQAFVFCAFSAPHKLNPAMFDIWMRLLRDFPDSLLWLRTGLRACNENLRAEAARRGVSPERIVFAPIVSMPEHLARHRAADLFLDTFPYNQHSSASDALRMGLPVLTLTGKTFAARVAGSLLTNLGFPELIADAPAIYESTARRLAAKRDELNAIRTRLQQTVQGHALFDGRQFARKLEDALEKIIKEHVPKFD